MERLLRPVELGQDLCLVVVQHLSPSHPSMLVKLLSRVTDLEVITAETGQRLVPDTVIVIPPGQVLTIVDGHVLLTPRPDPPTVSFPIDDLFVSIAESLGDAAIAVVLSGTGSDGTAGARQVRVGGGLVIAEDPGTAQFDGMPRSVIDAGLADAVLPADAILQYLLDPTSQDSSPEETAENTAELEALLASISNRVGVNFDGYKIGTIARRAWRRARHLGMESLSQYQQMLDNDEDETQALFHDILIHVTWFFRDPTVWDALAERAIAPMIAAASDGQQLRAWVAGCATGEEVYTLAILLLEEVARSGRNLSVRVFGTDVDKMALEKASAGLYSADQVASISPERLRTWFERDEENYRVGPLLRRAVVFAAHDFVRDAPFTRVDLISCRNVLIYLGQELQRKALESFRFALGGTGFLLLGLGESVGVAAESFQTVARDQRIFTATSRGRPRSVATGTLQAARPQRVVGRPSELPFAASSLLDLSLEQVLSDQSSVGVLVDRDGQLLHTFGDLSGILRVPSGQSTLNILDLAAANVGPTLTGTFARAIRTAQTVASDLRLGSENVLLTVRPLTRGHQTEVVGALISVGPSQVPATTGSNNDMQSQLEELHLELKNSMREQQGLVAQLEAANEILNATNEELVASNEELQATNEELQSVNEELQTLNYEYSRRIDELEVLRQDLDHLLRATDVGTLIVDRNGIIKRFTPFVSEFVPVLERDVGRPLSDLASNSVTQDVGVAIASVLATGEPTERSIESLKGPVLVRCFPYRSYNLEGVLVTFVDVTVVKRSFEVARRVLDGLPASVAFINREGVITMVNAAWERFSDDNGGATALTGLGANYLAACDNPEVAEGLMGVLAGRANLFTHVYPCPLPNGEERWFLLQCTPVGDEAVVIHFDITVQKQAERTLMGLATHDPLTGCLNRRGIEIELERALSRAARTQRKVSSIMIDCDDFKLVNERVGHAGGDAVLRTVVERISSALRAGDLLARIGGDEFLVLLPEASLAEAHEAAERLRLAVASRPVALSHDEIELTISLSVVEVDSSIRTLEHLLDRSRDGLKGSKLAGKNRVTDERNQLGGSLRRQELITLMDSGAIHFAAQKIVTPDGAELLGSEVLMRADQAHGLQGPLALFRLAMEEGMLHVFDRHVLEAALATIRGHQPITGPWHINMYPSTLLQLTPARLEELFAPHNGQTDSQIVIELSEQQVVGDPSVLLPNIACLRSMGVKLALDDVGSGRTSLETLLTLEPDILKADIAMVHDIDSNQVHRRSLARLLDLARSCDATVIAEGVETLSELRTLEEIGVTGCQGFLFARPEMITADS